MTDTERTKLISDYSQAIMKSLQIEIGAGKLTPEKARDMSAKYIIKVEEQPSWDNLFSLLESCTEFTQKNILKIIIARNLDYHLFEHQYSLHKAFNRK